MFHSLATAVDGYMTKNCLKNNSKFFAFSVLFADVGRTTKDLCDLSFVAEFRATNKTPTWGYLNEI